MRRDKKLMPTSIWLTREERQLLAVAGAVLNLNWSTYLKKVGLEHARTILSANPPIIRVGKKERIIFDDDDIEN